MMQEYLMLQQSIYPFSKQKQGANVVEPNSWEYPTLISAHISRSRSNALVGDGMTGLTFPHVRSAGNILPSYLFLQVDGGSDSGSGIIPSESLRRTPLRPIEQHRFWRMLPFCEWNSPCFLVKKSSAFESHCWAWIPSKKLFNSIWASHIFPQDIAT